MACIQPTTRSLGYVFLDYTTNAGTIERRMRLRLTYPISPSDLSTIRTEAQLWASAVGACSPNSTLYSNWGTMNPDGSVFHVEALAPAVIGTHSSPTGAQAWRSATVSLTGRGEPVAGGQCAGAVRTVLYTGNAFLFVPQQKVIIAGVDTALDTLRDFLTGNSVLGADFYGNVGNWKGVYPIQFNASAQRRLGS